MRNRRIVVTDCGSTTTKALLFQQAEDGWRFLSRGEAPTTVEAPAADVTIGVMNAFSELEELVGAKFTLNDNNNQPVPLKSSLDSPDGIDAYYSTSSAGGGLQMMVAGVVGAVSTESAQRAALGAGAVVIDAVSGDDGRQDHDRIARIRGVRPDIFLLCGGIDGGAVAQVVELAELLAAAAPRPRFGDTRSLPILFAGNQDAAEEVKRLLEPIGQVAVVANVRPTLDKEQLGPAREAIHEFFLSHVMSHSPGYSTLMQWVDTPVMPTPLAVGVMIEQVAKKAQCDVLAVDIGGATTDVFSVCRDSSGAFILTRTVSANLGMSYSIGNVLLEAGVEQIVRWIPMPLSSDAIRNRIRNKMIRPTTIPQTLDDLHVEQAVCREALRLSLRHHKSLALDVARPQADRGIQQVFGQGASERPLVDMMRIGIVIGSGGVLSHAPDRIETAMMLIDGFETEGVTRLMVDSVFMLPHLGVFSTREPEGALQILYRDCLIHLGYSICPVGYKGSKTGELLAKVFVDGHEVGAVIYGSVSRIELTGEGNFALKVVPVGRGVTVGAGPNLPFELEGVRGGIGLICDGRGRPIKHGSSTDSQIANQREIARAVGIRIAQ